jgi:RNA polymerase sigma-70 factor (ECF subfamily)
MSTAPVTRPSLLLRLRDTDDTEAWSQFVSLYTPLIFGHCKRHGLQDADAADVAQEVMRAVAAEMPQFQYDAARGKFRGWLLQTTRHRLHKFLERRDRAPAPASEATLEHYLEQEPGPDEQARWEQEYQQRLFDWAAGRARAEFQSATWEAFRLTAVESLSVKETAARLGISGGAVYIARSRVIARLRELIQSVSDDATPP